MTDIVTPAAFDLALICIAVPLVVVVFVLILGRVRRYRYRPTGAGYASIIAGYAWMAGAVAFLSRPLADLFPGQFGESERVATTAALVICLIVAVTLTWHERKG